MEISRYIKDLLFLHDCVVIPGFGGFLSGYQPAEIQKYKHVIYPPSKSVSFNKQLQHNDGLLINHLIQNEKCTYKAAEEKVKKFVNGCYRLLENKEIILFPEIGKLYVNASGNLIFLPQLRKNLLPGSFGLKPISFNPQYHRPEEQQATEKESISNEQNQKAREINRPRRKNRRFEVTGLSLSILLIILISQLIIWDFSPEKIKLQGLHIGSHQTVETKTGTVMADIVKKRRAIAIKENPFSDQLRTGNNQPTASSQNNGTGYYIVIGAFQNYSNATHLKEQLQLNNETAVIIKTPTGFHRVAIFASANKSRALEKLQYYKHTNNPSSWMFYKKS